MMTTDKRKPWTIKITPTRTGVKVHTQANVNDVLADRLSRAIEQFVAQFAQTA
jgi:hypothetical protein